MPTNIVLSVIISDRRGMKMFVRVKKIKGRKYAYLVENEWTPWGSRQKVTKYLGKTITLPRISDGQKELPKELNNALKTAIEQELENHGFKNGRKDNINVNLEENKIEEDGRKIVLAMNEGYMCDHTLKQLFEFKPAEKPTESATKLANLAVEAGLKLSHEQFLHLFEQAN